MIKITEFLYDFIDKTNFVSFNQNFVDLGQLSGLYLHDNKN